MCGKGPPHATCGTGRGAYHSRAVGLSQKLNSVEYNEAYYTTMVIKGKCGSLVEQRERVKVWSLYYKEEDEKKKGKTSEKWKTSEKLMKVRTAIWGWVGERRGKVNTLNKVERR